MNPFERTPGNTLLSEAREAAERSEWQRCLEICDRGIQYLEDLEDDAWIGLRLGLATIALNWEQASDDLLDRAIGEVKRIVTSDRMKLTDPRLGAAFRYLGGLHKARRRGDRRSNLTDAFEYYEKALGIFREDRFPGDWALLKVNIALAIQSRVGVLAKQFLRSNPAELEIAIESLEYSIRSCEDALRVYTADEWPEEYEEANSLADHARRMIRRLKEMSRPGYSGDSFS